MIEGNKTYLLTYYSVNMFGYEVGWLVAQCSSIKSAGFEYNLNGELVVDKTCVHASYLIAKQINKHLSQVNSNQILSFILL